jgi:sirohydrochlorin cobaltochelatase
MASRAAAVVLAAHGAPATDYPRMRVGLLMMLEFSGKMAEHLPPLRTWRERLASQAAAWPRTPENDPYKAAVDGLAASLSRRLGFPVLAAYNEFCTPPVGQAIDSAIAGGAAEVVVVPTMLVRGNQHTELEILEAVVQARHRHPGAVIHYAWPFEEGLLVSLLAEVVTERLSASPKHEA